MNPGRVFVYVQHLLGIGHFRRATTLARALAARGLEVTLASGGSPVRDVALGGVRVLQLPAVRAADASFRRLVDADGRDIDDAWRARRREALLAAWRESSAQLLIVELFPFGRRQMRFELLPLLELASGARPRPVVVCSVRDLLGLRPDPERHDAAAAIVERHFDHVLVHGDAALVPFERSFLATSRIAARLHYTGYVVDAAREAGDNPQAGRDEVIVSAGGGAVGGALLEAAIRARADSPLAARTWRILSGVNVAAAEHEALRARAAREAPGIVVEPAREDFPTLLRNCALSISQGGYNTVMEVLQARARAVLAPFAGGDETEQTLRARLLAARGLVEVIEHASLSPAALVQAMTRALARPRPAAGAIDLGGAARSAELIAGWAGADPA